MNLHFSEISSTALKRLKNNLHCELPKNCDFMLELFIINLKLISEVPEDGSNVYKRNFDCLNASFKCVNALIKGNLVVRFKTFLQILVSVVCGRSKFIIVIM